MDRKAAACASPSVAGPTPQYPAAKPESPALMWLTFFIMGIMPLILFAVFDWYSASFALAYFLPPLTAAVLCWYAVPFCLGILCWLLFFIRPVPGAKGMELGQLREKRRAFWVFAIPGLALSSAFSYAVAKNGFGLVETALISTAFWLLGLVAIQLLKYMDEFVLKNHPDCEACHSPLELGLFVFAAAPGSVFAVIGHALALFI